MKERDLIARLLAPIATHPAARGLVDDAAVLVPPLGRDLVLTHDMIAEGVHYLPGDPPGDVAQKLLAVNLSDLAAMGARPLGVLLGLGLSACEDEAWLRAFVGGLAEGCARWGAPLLGGDTVRGLDRAVLGMTALGQVAQGAALGRAGARVGDTLWVSGNIGDAWLGLEAARGRLAGVDSDIRTALIARYRRPEPRIALGGALVGIVNACMDVSDGLLIDAQRLGAASGVAIALQAHRIPVSRAAEAAGADPLALAAGGDDYELLFAADAQALDAVIAAGKRTRTRLTVVGRVRAGAGLVVEDADGRDITPARLGWEH